jgi:arylsulfatase A-like enzyme
MRAIRTDRHKLIRNFEVTYAVEVPGDVEGGAIFRNHVHRYHGGVHPPVELYDLASDPLEMTSLAGRAETAELQRDLDEKLRDWMIETGDPLLNGPVPSPRARQLRVEWLTSPP